MDAGALWSRGDYAAAGDRWAEASTRVAEAHAAAGLDVLDIACGPGALAIAAARAGARVTGLDAAPALLDLARTRAEAAGVAVDWIEADMTALPVPDEAFDLVASAFGCMFAPDPEAMAAELVRVCRPGGRIAVLAWTPESAFGAMGPLAGAYLPGQGVGAPVHRWARADSVREVFAGLPVELESTVRTVNVVWADLDQAMSELTGGNPAWLAIRAGVEPTGRWPELESRLRELLAERGRTDTWFTLPVDYLETVATRA
ncbi:class I SAM-dependent methyltransferase [Glycomyces terrestris]|uniref:Class I SAM-dependent methyltransferase n=1 Tax=Glycomyces terrestris TaxID=2493553 RepID=A0A426V3H7_9ACTN|nr:class I SAM-dependent methyltransferase [Glycomyces terrestris]RRS01391.1 class I SAM-dependent methyltransferase [Glycomyces terrestris]